MHISRKLVIVGDGCVGKTCILVCKQKGEFPEIHVPTVFDNYIIDVTVDDKLYELALWDTAGQESFDRLRPLSYPDTNVIIICYDITNKNSIENIIERWVPEIKHYLPGVPFVLCGTKKDLVNERQVSYVAGELLAKSIGANYFIECSSKSGENLDQLFDEAIRLTKPKPHTSGHRFCKIL